MNTLAEKYWPLALQTARASIAWQLTADHDPKHSARLADASNALHRMALHTKAMQDVAPVRVLGINTNARLLNSIVLAGISFLASISKSTADMLEKGGHVPSSLAMS